MCAKTALYNTREKVNFFNNNIDFIIEQKEYWQNQLYDIFEEISNVMKKKYDELNSQVTELFTKLERYNSEWILAFGSLASRLEYYLKLSEDTFEFDIAKLNNSR